MIFFREVEIFPGLLKFSRGWGEDFPRESIFFSEWIKVFPGVSQLFGDFRVFF